MRVTQLLKRDRNNEGSYSNSNICKYILVYIHIISVAVAIMISGWVMFAILIGVNTFVHVAIQLYFEGHPAFNDEAAEALEKQDEKTTYSSNLPGQLQQQHYLL